MLGIASAAASYVLVGISKVSRDLSASPIEQPPWAWHPTLGKMVLVGALWPYIEISNSGAGRVGRRIAFGLLSVLVEWAMCGVLIWSCLALALSVFKSTVLEGIAFLVLFVLGNLIVMPLVSLLMVPVMFLLAWPLDLIFSLTKTDR